MSDPLTIPRSRTKPLMVYDGECHFCMRWVTRWKKTTGNAVDYLSLQEASADFPEIPRASFEQEVKLITVDGMVFGGASAVFRSLNLGEQPGWLVRRALWMYRNVPGFAPVTEAAYRFVAEHRSFFSAITRWTALIGIP